MRAIHRIARRVIIGCLLIFGPSAGCVTFDAPPMGVDADREPPSEVAATPWPVTAFPDLPEIMKDVPDARIELGRMLFFDPILSVDHETACVTCHSERWGMGDAIPRGIGHGAGLNAGPNRNGPNVLRRNSMAIYNMAFRETLLWDGAETELEEQAKLALFKEDEMGTDETTMLAEVSAVPEYVDRFAEAFPGDPAVTMDNLTAALAAYQRTFISNRATYDAYVDGRPRLMTEEQVEGMFRFAEMGCDGCHVPPMFESETFANRNVPDVHGVVDHGLEEVTGLESDRGKFRAVSLRNFKDNAPYFHNGSIELMSQAVRHELEQTGLPYTDEDARLIQEFLDGTLRDDSTKAIRPVSVPSGLPLPIDPARPPFN